MAALETTGGKAADGRTARQFMTEFFTSFTREITADDGDPGPVVDRYYTPDAVQTADGIRIDRERLVAHIRPVRKNLSDFAFEVHEAVRDGERIAARFTIHATDRRGRHTATEVHLFGELAPDGRMRRTHQLSRTVGTPEADANSTRGNGPRGKEASEEGDGS
ncbi:nuclear transport factor 2 family protein [Streptomyces phytophilus]|uniref:nuclear transport factor 2 family protein n=1 Tax=Streptomyces phytophilus TaxID=722715 RepID=UPI0015F08815|nr:nuclear transport factor 2 family protein [Streptomyces phytophilus]